MIVVTESIITPTKSVYTNFSDSSFPSLYSSIIDTILSLENNHSLLNKDLNYPIFTLSSLVAINLENGSWEVIDRIVGPLANSTIFNILTTIL